MLFKVIWMQKFFKLISSIIPKWRTLELLRWLQNLHLSTWKHEGSSLVTMEATLFSCLSWAHTCATTGPTDTLFNHSKHDMYCIPGNRVAKFTVAKQYN
jgi:hypothetical protein